MTFNINRPLYSFGLAAAGTVLLGIGSCVFPVEDARAHIVEHQDTLSVTDMRVFLQGDSERRPYVFDVRTFRVYDDRIFLVTDDRVFEVEDDRVFIVERKCNGD